MDTEALKNIDINKLKGEQCRRSLYKFLKEFWDEVIAEPMVDNWHIEYLCNELEVLGKAILNNEEKPYDLIINISPGTTKSTIASVMFPAWLWANDASKRVIAGSHAKSLATDLAVKSRDIIQSEKYKQYFPNVEFKSDVNNKTAYKTTEGGERNSTSVGSSAIGKHAHAIIVDDPTKVNPSEGEIKEANKWITNDLATRKVDKDITPTILIMQRVAENDPTSHMLEKIDNVKHICLPAELTDDVKPQHLRKHYEKGLMDTKRLSYDTLEDMKARLGSFGYSSQFLQTPQPIEGGTIKKQWIQYVDKSDDELLSALNATPPQFFLDTAYTNKESNDPTAILTAKQNGNLLYIIDAREVWKEFPQLIEFLQGYFERHGYNSRSKVYVEPKASGKSIVQYLQRQTKYNVMEDKPPSESKEVRLQSVAPKIEAQKVYLMKGSWNDNFVQQITHAKPARDDMRDTMIMAIRKLLIESNTGEYAWR